MLENPLVVAFLMALACQLMAWLWQLKHNNADSVDLAWSASICLIAVYYLIEINAALLNQLFVCLFPLLWYGRLSLHLWLRMDKNHEDNRYRNLRAHWHKNTQGKFLMFFVFQAVLSFLFALPAYWVLTGLSITVGVLVFVVIWGVLSMIGVSMADWQLYQFKANPKNKGKVCDQGLWRYSRHPNYFFEWLHWWVYPAVLFPSYYFCWATIIVFIMLYFLLNLTGIPYSEQQALKSRGEAYRAYQESTSAIILWRKK